MKILLWLTLNYCAAEDRIDSDVDWKRKVLQNLKVVTGLILFKNRS